MHLESLVRQEVMVPAGPDGMELRIRLNKGEIIHTENSYKFNAGTIDEMLTAAGFSVMKVWTDLLQTFALTLANRALGSRFLAEAPRVELLLSIKWSRLSQAP
jgi:uncharacterized SAM-dependent methyltransferase